MFNDLVFPVDDPESREYVPAHEGVGLLPGAHHVHDPHPLAVLHLPLLVKLVKMLLGHKICMEIQSIVS